MPHRSIHRETKHESSRLSDVPRFFFFFFFFFWRAPFISFFFFFFFFFFFLGFFFFFGSLIFELRNSNLAHSQPLPSNFFSFIHTHECARVEFTISYEKREQGPKITQNFKKFN
jgi:hypothetical protein